MTLETPEEWEDAVRLIIRWWDGSGAGKTPWVSLGIETTVKESDVPGYGCWESSSPGSLSFPGFWLGMDGECIDFRQML